MRVAPLPLVILAMDLPNRVMGGTYEFVPDSGLPSLASLGLTVANLFNATWVDELFKDTRNPFAAPSNTLMINNNPQGHSQDRGPVSPSWTDICDEQGRDLGAVSAIKACAAYLYVLDEQWCEAGNWPVEFARVTKGDSADTAAVVQGISIRPGRARSFCRDCAPPVYWIAESCARGGCEKGDERCLAGGSAAAWGNGDLIMLASGTGS